MTSGSSTTVLTVSQDGVRYSTATYVTEWSDGTLHETVDGTQGDVTVAWERIVVDEHTYRRNAGGPWIESTAPASTGATLDDELDRLAKTVGLDGTETVGGRTLHRLVPADSAQLDPAAIGAIDPSITGYAATVVFLADADGTLAGLRIGASWSRSDEGVTRDVELSMETAFGRAGQRTITKPADVWVRFQSAGGYAFATPETWIHSVVDGTDVFTIVTAGGGHDLLIGGSRLQVWRWAPPGRASLSGLTAEIQAQWEKDLRAEVAVENVRAGDHDGSMLTVSTMIDGAPAVVYGVLVVDGPDAYSFVLMSTTDVFAPGTDLAMLQMLLRTFTTD